MHFAAIKFKFKFFITYKHILRFAKIKEQQDSRKKSVLLDCDFCELLLRFFRPVGLTLYFFLLDLSISRSLSLDLSLSRIFSLSNILDRTPRGGKLSNLARGTSSCLSRRVVLITQVIKIFVYGGNRCCAPLRSSVQMT